MSHARHGVGKFGVVLIAAALLLCAGIAANTVTAFAQPAWENETAPGTITFEVDVTYDDGSGEEQDTSDTYDVSVIQVRAWELVPAESAEVLIRPDGDGTTVSFDSTLYNLGNYQDTVDSLVVEYWNGTAWVGDITAWSEESAAWSTNPTGWSHEILVDGVAATSVENLAPNGSATIRVNLTATDETGDGDWARVRLKATADAISAGDLGTLHDIVGHPAIDEAVLISWEDGDPGNAWQVKIVLHLLTFALYADDPELEPRGETTFTGIIKNPSWSEVPVELPVGEETKSMKVTIPIPDGMTYEDGTVSLIGTGFDEANCSAAFVEDTLIITCSTAFPTDAELQISFDVRVDPYTPPTGGEIAYEYNGDVTYVDITDAQHTVYAGDKVGDDLPGDPGYPDPAPTPEITVLTVRLVRVYDSSDGEWQPADPIQVSATTNPGSTETFNIWVKNEGNVTDSYTLDVISQKLAENNIDPKFAWTVVCNPDVNATGNLTAGESRQCTVTGTFPSGSQNEDDADLVEFQATSTDETVASNEIEITVHVNAPDIVAELTVWTDAAHQNAATQIQPGDTVYIKATVRNTGRLDATDITVTHIVPSALEYGGDAVADINGSDVSGNLVYDANTTKITVSNITLAADEGTPENGEILTITYSGEVK